MGAESMLEAALAHWQQQQQTGARGGAPPAAKGKGAAATAASSAQGGWCLEGLVGLKLKLGKVDEAVRCYQQLQQAGGGGGQRQTAASAGVSARGGGGEGRKGVGREKFSAGGCDGGPYLPCSPPPGKLLLIGHCLGLNCPPRSPLTHAGATSSSLPPPIQVLGRLIRAVASSDTKAAVLMEKELPGVSAAQVCVWGGARGRVFPCANMG